VRRPQKPDDEDVHALLLHFEQAGFDGVQRFLGIDPQERTILSYVDGFVPAGAILLRRVHDLTAGTAFAAGSEVACHPNLSQPNFVFRDMSPVAIIDWDGTRPGTRLENLAGFLWAFVHPGAYGEGEPAARMLRAAVDAYEWSGPGLVDAMLEVVRRFQGVVAGDPGAEAWAAHELAYLGRNAGAFRRAIG
jgi:Ser/Thr protein kinase RdoA (MazF antagonist)